MWCFVLACCAAITELVLNDTNAHQVVQVKDLFLNSFSDRLVHLSLFNFIMCSYL